MKKLIRGIVIVAFLCVALTGGQLWAQGVSGNPVNVTVQVNIQQYLWLWFDTDTLNFPWTTPQNPPVWIAADANPHSIVALAFVPTGQEVRLQAQATGELVSGRDIIPVANHIRWTGALGFAGGPWYLTTSAQDIVEWSGFGIRRGTFSFEYYNDPQAPGTYKTTLVYTLVSP
ncbi:MAG: hypothetical protein U9O50_02195 [Acidobacteriota bacterium]|nr:hypothetical protein [Acidobacteriota bacterium]